MEKWVHIEELRAGADVEVCAVGRQVGLSFVRPDGVEAFAQNVVADGLPIPRGRLGICSVNVRSGSVIRLPVNRCAVGEVDKPAFLTQFRIKAVVGHKPRPDADHGFKAHGMEFLVHGRRVRPELWIHVHLPHLCVIEPVNNHDICWQVAIAIALRYVQHFLLAGVTLLALDVAIGGLRQHVGGSSEKPVARIDFVRGGAGNHEERNPVANFRRPAGLLVEAGFDDGF